MIPARAFAVLGAVLTVVLTLSRAVAAHDGPPFPIASDVPAGPYRLSVWTDPDTTDDGTPGGQFWITIDPLAERTALPQDTRASVAITPLSRRASPLEATTAPVRNDATNQFAALVMDHEGPFAVHVTVTGPLGRGSVDAEVSATYDARPAPVMLAVYLLPFLLVGMLWIRLVLRRRASVPRPR
jgi:hypothetical protein